jgi:hypothetical protein
MVERMKLFMTMTKELLLPVGCQLMDEEEMTYVEGGKVTSLKKTAKQASTYCSAWGAAWGSLATGYGVSAAVAAATGVGVGVGLVGGAGAAYCGYVAKEYLAAYNAAQKLTIGNKNPTVYVDEVTLLGFITAVDIRQA